MQSWMHVLDWRATTRPEVTALVDDRGARLSYAQLHTSGTTGKAKAIPLRHGALMASVADFAIEIGDQVAGSRHLQILPLFHLGGFGQAMQALLTAGTIYIHTTFSPPAVIDAIGRDRIEFFTAGPSLIDMLVAEIGRRAGSASWPQGSR